MRIVRFLHDGRARYGVQEGATVEGATVTECPDAHSFSDMLGAPAASGRAVAAADVRFLTPVDAPGKVICIGLNYRDHAAEGGNPIPDYPAVFLRGTTSLVAHGEPLVRPSVSTKFDWEAELAVVIGRAARRVSTTQALDHVAGYSCFNDGSIRDYQRKSTQWTMGKNFDGTGAFGPAVVTPDELPAGARGLRVVTRVNGAVMQDGNTADMIFDVPTLIATLSEAMTLEVGDVIVTGTPAGVGYPRKPPVFLKAGDVCEVEIDGVGTVSNPVEDARD